MMMNREELVSGSTKSQTVQLSGQVYAIRIVLYVDPSETFA